MRSLIATFIVAPLTVLGLLATPAPAAAQRIIDLGTDTLSLDKSSRSDVEVKVIEDGDTSRVIIRGPGKRYRVDDGEAAIVRTGESITIESGRIVEGDVVSIGGSVTVLGEVRGDAVSIGGNVNLKDGAEITGDAVAIGGRVRKADGARLGGQEVGMNFIPTGFIPSRHDESGVSFLGLTALLVFALFLFLLAWLLHALSESRLTGTTLYLVDHPWKSLFTGLAIVLLAPLGVVILAVTIVGIPVALLVMALLPIVHIIGFLLVAAAAGNRLISRGNSGLSWGWVKSVASGLGLFLGIILFGSLFRSIGGVMSAFGWVLSIFGWTLSFLAATVGLGAIVLSRFGRPATDPLLVPPPPQFTAPVSP